MHQIYSRWLFWWTNPKLLVEQPIFSSEGEIECCQLSSIENIFYIDDIFIKLTALAAPQGISFFTAVFALFLVASQLIPQGEFLYVPSYTKMEKKYCLPLLIFFVQVQSKLFLRTLSPRNDIEKHHITFNIGYSIIFRSFSRFPYPCNFPCIAVLWTDNTYALSVS